MAPMSPARVPVLAAMAVVGTVAVIALVVLTLGWSGGTQAGAGTLVDDAALRAAEARPGMPSFAGLLSDVQVAAIRAYLLGRRAELAER